MCQLCEVPETLQDRFDPHPLAHMAVSTHAASESMGALSIARSRTPNPNYWEGDTGTEAWVMLQGSNAANTPPFYIANPEQLAKLTHGLSNFNMGVHVQANKHSHGGVDPGSQSGWQEQLVFLFQYVSSLLGTMEYMGVRFCGFPYCIFRQHNAPDFKHDKVSVCRWYVNWQVVHCVFQMLYTSQL